MPRQDWFDDDTTTRERRDRTGQGSGDSDQGRREYRDRGFFGSDDDGRDHHRDGRGRSSGSMGSNDRDRERDRSPGWAQDRDDRRFGPDDHGRGIPMDETERLIASNKVEGTPVYDRHEDKLGTIHNFMVDKCDGRVVYAVLKHGGGFLGLNERYYPLEWAKLTYDTGLGGYHVRMTEEDLKDFGSFDSDGRWQSRRRGREERGSQDRDRDRSGNERDGGRASRHRR